jgi:hypothetical protein
LLSDLSELELELELGLLADGLAALGLELEPEAALPEVLPELEPPPAWSFFEESIDPDPEPDAESDGVALELDGEDGVVEPDDEEAEPDGEVVVPREAARSPVLSHAATSAVPRATETARARVLNLI